MTSDIDCLSQSLSLLLIDETKIIKIILFIECLQRPNGSWKERFLSNIRNLKL